MEPLAPRATCTRLATVLLAGQLRLEGFGRGAPAGHRVTAPAAVVSSAVTLTTTALTPERGTPPANDPEGFVPSTRTVRLPPALSFLPRHCRSRPESFDGLPLRVSQIL